MCCGRYGSVCGSSFELDGITLVASGTGVTLGKYDTVALSLISGRTAPVTGFKSVPGPWVSGAARASIVTTGDPGLLLDFTFEGSSSGSLQHVYMVIGTDPVAFSFRVPTRLFRIVVTNDQATDLNLNLNLVIRDHE